MPSAAAFFAHQTQKTQFWCFEPDEEPAFRLLRRVCLQQLHGPAWCTKAAPAATAKVLAAAVSVLSPPTDAARTMMEWLTAMASQIPPRLRTSPRPNNRTISRRKNAQCWFGVSESQAQSHCRKSSLQIACTSGQGLLGELIDIGSDAGSCFDAQFQLGVLCGQWWP